MLHINDLPKEMHLEIAVHLDHASVARFLSTSIYFYKQIKSSQEFQVQWKSRKEKQDVANEDVFKNADEVVKNHLKKPGSLLPMTTYLSLLARLKDNSEHAVLFEKQEEFWKSNVQGGPGCYSICIPYAFSMLGVASGGIPTGIFTHSFGWGVLGGIGGGVVLGLAPWAFYALRYNFHQKNKLKAEREVSNIFNLPTTVPSEREVAGETTALIPASNNNTNMLTKLFSCVAKRPDLDRSSDAALDDVVVDLPANSSNRKS